MNKDSFISNIKKKSDSHLAMCNIKRRLFSQSKVFWCIMLLTSVGRGFNVGGLRELYEALYSENERDVSNGSIRLIKKYC